MKKTFAMLLLLLLAAPVAAQQMANVAEQREAMKKWERWVGRWQGSGWIDYGGQRMTFMIDETIQSKLGGIALLVEGRGKTRMPGKQEETVIHEALATITYDDKAKKYRFVTQTEKGHFGMPDIKVTDDGWQWGFRDAGGGGILYTIKYTDKGEWFEYGERSQDGKTWQRFHEMTLKRVK